MIRFSFHRRRKTIMKRIPKSAFRPLPPPRRCNNGSKSSMISEEERSTSRIEELNYKTRPYYFRRSKRGRPTNIESLPNDLLSEILVRLPADYLYDIARIVCRRWCCIIHSHEFISTQVQHSSYGLLLHNSNGPRSSPIFVTSTQGLIEKSEFSYKCRTCILGSCNGLAMDLVRNKGIAVHIINPATKQPFTLPSFSPHKIFPNSYGIGYAAASMEYKVVVTYCNKNSSPYLLILTAGVDKCWRYVRFAKMPENDRFLLMSRPLITEGFMHWTDPFRREDFFTLNVETEILTVSKIKLVPHTPFISSGLQLRFSFLSTGRSLTLLFDKGNNILELWEMNSESREWAKMADINLEGKLKQFVSNMVFPLGWVKYPEVLALTLSVRRLSRGTIIFYNLDTQEITTADLPEHELPFEAIVHKNNLQWLS